MLKVHSGPFHPHLEDAFVATVTRLARPFAPLSVVAPSGRLRDRAQMLLASRGLALAGVQFHTVGSFADEVLSSVGGSTREIVSDPLFFDTVVRQILRKDRPFEGFADLAVPDGFPPSVRATLRDLVDAGVEPEKLLDAVNEREEFNIPDVDAGSLKQLIRLYRLYLDRLDAIKVASRSAVMEQAAGAAAASPFLSGFEAILFYGFYDLTGLQVTFFEEVARHHATEIFVPYLHRHPDHEFSARFRGDVLHKIPHEEILLAEAVEPFSVVESGAQVEIFNVSGLRDEAWTVATEILKRRDAGVPFSEMAVIARTRERLSRFGPVFVERGIPFTTSWQGTLASAPQTEVGLQLLAAEAGEAAARDAFQSPDVVGPEAPEPAMEWPLSATWAAHVDRAKAALDRWVKPSTDESAEVWTRLFAEVAALKDFGRISDNVTRSEFLDAVRARWTGAKLPPEGGGVGVAILHGEAARGLPFDTVFLAGLEERVFPRVVREDPFLRDKTRHAISHTIGNRIGEKMLALAEERLLFHLILSAARSKVFITYQRSDDEGKIVGASSFLRRLIAERGLAFDDAVKMVPRRMTDKLASAPPETLGVRDLVSGLLMAGRAVDAVRLASAVGRDGASLARGAAFAEGLESWEGAGAHDGLVGAGIGAGHLSGAGLSPSGLEAFGRCPFQYFVSRVLRVKPLDEAPSPEEIAADVRGKLVHAFLETFYLDCAKRFPGEWPAAAPESVFDGHFAAVFAQRPPEVFPLLWNALREALRSQLFSLVSADFRVLAERGLRPAYFELRHGSAELDAAFGGTRVEGIMDRLDVGPGRARVVDYKSGGRPGLKVTTLVVRGQKAQPALYLMMAAEVLKSRGIPADAIDFSYLHLGEQEPLTEMTAAAWTGIRPDAADTIRTQVAHIAAGRFPLMPGRHCEWCDAAAVCRVNDSVSVFRTEPELAELRRLQKKRPGGAS